MTQSKHDIEQLIEKCSKVGVTRHVARKAFESIASHSEYINALNHPVCHPIIKVEPISFFDRSRLPDKIKSNITKRLEDTTTVVLIALMTSDIKPTDQFVGGGLMFEFVLHPDTYEILHNAISAWHAS